jgi:hypothetical protein
MSLLKDEQKDVFVEVQAKRLKQLALLDIVEKLPHVYSSSQLKAMTLISEKLSEELITLEALYFSNTQAIQYYQGLMLSEMELSSVQ